MFCIDGIAPKAIHKPSCGFEAWLLTNVFLLLSMIAAIQLNKRYR